MGHVALAALIAFAVPFAIALVLSRLAIRIAPKIGFLDRPGGHKAHEHAIPLGGGVAIFVGFGLPVAAALLAARAGLAGLPVGVGFAALAARSWPLSLVLVGGFLLMVLGLLDDARSLSVPCRLIVQGCVAAGLYLASPELRITLFTGWKVLSFLYTVLWIMAITNAFNFLDNMDGLCGGVALVAAGNLAVVGFQTGQPEMALLALALAGAAAGFLVLNFPPARLYMGDAGSLFLGFTLSVLTVLFTFYRSGPAPSGRLYGVLMPLFILALPVFDTVTVVAIRLREGRPVWKGDRNHFSHRLVALGMSKREAVLFIYLLTFCLGLASTLLSSLDSAGAVTIFAIAVIIFVLIALLERAGRRKA